MQIFFWLKNSFLEEQDRWILWTPIIFGAGIIFYFSYPHYPSYTFPLLLFCGSAALAIFFRKELPFLILIFITLFCGGFLWGKFHSEIIMRTPQIPHPLYVNAVGKIESITPYENSITHKSGAHLLLRNIQLHKIDYSKEPVKKKIKKPKKKKEKVKKPHKKRVRKAKSLENTNSKTAEKKISKTKKTKKKSKKDSKTVIKNYLNIENYQEIDRELKWLALSYPKGEWHNDKYTNPPEKILISAKNNENIQIGDVILVRVFLENYKKPKIISGYDFARDAYFKSIGAHGSATGNIIVLKKARLNNFDEWINNLRQKIAEKISSHLNQDQASIAIALTVGYQDYISKDLMNHIRNSGLSHLLSISGLHLTLAFGIFFFTTRFILSCFSNLALNYDIKKIAAAISILTGLSYLMLAGAPVPAVRSFIMVGLIFVAILFDQNPRPHRSIAFAALAILLLSPNSILSISFQLSFAAILALITLYDFIAGSAAKEKPFYLKFFWYFLGIIFSSLAAEIATTPFSIYHFNNYIQYGMIANLIAIPIASFLVMPWIFLSLFLMPLGIEQLAFYPMGHAIDLIIKIAHFVSSLPFSHHNIKMISKTSFGLIIAGGLWFCLWQKNWRWLGILPIILGSYLAYKNPLPDLLIDGDRKYFALYDADNNQLIFSKKVRPSSQINEWEKKMGAKNYRNIFDLKAEELTEKKIFCTKEFCKLAINQHSILILTARNKIDFICADNSEILVNLTKYKLPECSKYKVIIDNYDLFKKGGHFLYLRENQLLIKTVS